MTMYLSKAVRRGRGPWVVQSIEEYGNDGTALRLNHEVTVDIGGCEVAIGEFMAISSDCRLWGEYPTEKQVLSAIRTAEGNAECHRDLEAVEVVAYNADWDGQQPLAEFIRDNICDGDEDDDLQDVCRRAGWKGGSHVSLVTFIDTELNDPTYKSGTLRSALIRMGMEPDNNCHQWMRQNNVGPRAQDKEKIARLEDQVKRLEQFNRNQAETLHEVLSAAAGVTSPATTDCSKDGNPVPAGSAPAPAAPTAVQAPRGFREGDVVQAKCCEPDCGVRGRPCVIESINGDRAYVRFGPELGSVIEGRALRDLTLVRAADAPADPDPALVERLARIVIAAGRLVNDRLEIDGCDCIRAILAALTAEGRLCAPGEVERLNEQMRASDRTWFGKLTAVEAERDALRAEPDALKAKPRGKTRKVRAEDLRVLRNEYDKSEYTASDEDEARAMNAVGLRMRVGGAR